jgi:hypothetical protein
MARRDPHPQCEGPDREAQRRGEGHGLAMAPGVRGVFRRDLERGRDLRAVGAPRGGPIEDHDVRVPAGTRNHFARDLGVLRRDVVGVLEALITGLERSIDLGEVNGSPSVDTAGPRLRRPTAG